MFSGDLSEADDQQVIPQEQIAKAWTQNKAKAKMFIKNVPVAIISTSKLPKEAIENVKNEAGKRDQTGYTAEKFANGLAAIQAPKPGKGEVYIFDQSNIANYGPFKGQITTALAEYLAQLGIDAKTAKLYVKNTPTPFIPASVFGIEGKRIQTSWGDQAVDQGAFITQEANGHTYCCNPDAQGLPIGYVPAQQGVAEGKFFNSDYIFAKDGELWNKTIEGGSGTKQDPYTAKFNEPLRVLAVLMRSLALQMAGKDPKDTSQFGPTPNKLYYKHNNQLYIGDGTNKIMSVDKTDHEGMAEDLDANQKRVGQLGPTEKVGPKGAVGKLVGASESFINTVDQAVTTEGVEELAALKRLLGK
jgi:hypothetical protein